MQALIFFNLFVNFLFFIFFSNGATLKGLSISALDIFKKNK